MTMSEEELAEIEAAWAEATPGPWFVVEGSEIDHGPTYEIHKVQAPTEAVVGGAYGHGPQLDKEDAAAIAAAPEHIEKLLAEVKRLRSAIAKERRIGFLYGVLDGAEDVSSVFGGGRGKAVAAELVELGEEPPEGWAEER